MSTDPNSDARPPLASNASKFFALVDSDVPPEMGDGNRKTKRNLTKNH